MFSAVSMATGAGYTGLERPLDADLDKCTRCGLCEQSCPTYRVLRLEADSPRGRIFLMKQVALGEAAVDEQLAEHLYVCVGCRACETACPSGVPFGKLLEYGRFQVEEHGLITQRRRGWRIFRRLMFERLLPNRALFELLMAPARVLQRRPFLRRLARALPLPPRMRALIVMIPMTSVVPAVNLPYAAPARFQQDANKGSGAPAARGLPPIAPAQGQQRGKVGVFTGCVMRSLFAHVHAATARVLQRSGCEVVFVPAQWCCGALNVHAGERRFAKDLARRNVDAFLSAGVDFIIVNSAGCGSVLKEYGELLQHDPAYAEKAASFARQVKDVAEFLSDLDVRPQLAPVAGRITYQDACHLAHGQRIREQPRRLLRSIPGIDYVELPNSDRCCGAAGVYSLTHPLMANTLLEEKLDAIEQTGASIVVTGNPGCHMQLQAGLAARKRDVRVCHIVELLDEAYSGAHPPPGTVTSAQSQGATRT